MKPEITITRPENEGLELLKAIKRICEKHGWRHIEQGTEQGKTTHKFVKI